MANNNQHFRELIRDGAVSLGIALDAAAVHGLEAFMLELEKWNQKINLIARRTTPAEIIDKHILDSLTLLPFLDEPRAAAKSIENEIITIVDLGTGAGFPGLPLAIARPALKIFLVEPRAKRVSFLRHIVRSLGLAKVGIMAERFTDGEQLFDQQIDFITSRAVAEPEKFIKMVKPLMMRGTKALLMLGPEKRDLWCGHDPAGELKMTRHLDFVLPVSGRRRTVCQVDGDAINYIFTSDNKTIYKE